MREFATEPSTKWLYRLESTRPDNGLWYNANGELVWGIGKLPNCKTKNLPMEYDERYHKDGRSWHSSCSRKEDLLHWYSVQDALDLIAHGFVFTRYLATEYVEYPQETTFIKETCLAREEISIENLFGKPKGRGYFGIGVFHGKNSANIGTLWRSASILGADFIFTIGKRYQKQASDTMKSYRHIPLYHYEDYEDFLKHVPYSCPVIAVELDESAVPVEEFDHPERCIYLLGAEDGGIPKRILDRCQGTVQLMGDYCYNVAVAGSLVMYDRKRKERTV